MAVASHRRPASRRRPRRIRRDARLPLNPYDGRPLIYFSFAKGRYLAFATRDDSDYDALYAWWDQLKTFLP